MPDIVVVTESGIVTVSQEASLVTVYDGRGFPGTPGDTFDQTLNTTDAVEFAGLVNNGLTFPTADGTAGQVIETDGAGVLSFASIGGVSSLTAGTGISLDVTTGDITVTNSEPDQTVTLTNGTGITITGTYPSFTIDCDITQYTDTDARLSLSAGTGISYDNATGIITNDDPDQTVTLTDGTGITITGTYPSFTIDCDITQYTDTDARLALSAGTGISYDNATGIITNDEPDQTVTLTGGTDIAVTGTYPSFTIDFDGVIPIAADADTAGILYGLTTDNVSGYNVSLGFGANGSLTTGNYNVALGGAAGDMTSGNYNVAIGFDCNVADPTADKQLAIGPDAYVRWITGDANMNIKPGAGLKDSVNSVGTAGQLLSSTGTAIEWVDSVTSLIAGTGISVDVSTGDVTITNDEPDQTVTLTDGTGITITGTYPSFTIDCDITQYTDTDARLALSAGTGISYDDTTGIITNDEPDQTVTLTNGTDITITGTYPSFTIAYSGTAGSGTVTKASVVSANGFAGSVATDTTTPAITISTSITGLLKGDGTAISAATSGTDYVVPSGSITGNAATVTTNASLTGPITSSGNATSIASQTGTGTKFVMDTSPTLVTPNIGVATGTSLTLSGDLTVNGTTTTISSTTLEVGDKNIVLASASTTDAGADGGGITLKGTSDHTWNWIDATDAWTSSDHINLASGKSFYINGTAVLSATALGSGISVTATTNANLTGVITSVGNATSIASQTGTGTKFVVDTSPTLITPVLGTPSSGDLTNCTFPTLNQSTTGNAATVTTNANLTGVITSTGNATVIASQTGTGSKFVVDTSPTLVTPTIGAATATTINKITVTAPATGATLTIADGATLTASATASVSGTNTGDNAANTTYSSLVSNATHTGDATGDTALTVVAINGVLMSGLATGLLKNTTSTGAPSIATAGTDYVAPSGALGTPSSGDLTNCTFPTLNQSTTGNAATVTTNANLTGVITSTGNATVIASQTGTGTKFVVDTSPTLITPVLGTPSSGDLTNCTFPTLNQNTSGSAASLSATLAVTSGGTGQITATAAFNALAPSQASNSGKYLKTDGTDTSWGTLPSALPVLLFGGVTTTSVSVANGSLPVLLFGGVTTVNVTVT